MAKIYVVSDYDDLFIFSTREKAEEFARRTGHEYVEEEELDPEPPPLVDGCYAWRVDVFEQTRTRNVHLLQCGKMPRAFTGRKGTAVYCLARTAEEAIEQAKRLIEPHAATIILLRNSQGRQDVELPV